MTILFLAVGALLIGLAIPMVLRRIKPNKLYGLRVPATLADEWVWYEANARSGRDVLAVGALQIAAALLLRLVFEPASDQYVLGNTAVLTIGMLAAAVVGWRRANRLLQERRRSERG